MNKNKYERTQPQLKLKHPPPPKKKYTFINDILSYFCGIHKPIS